MALDHLPDRREPEASSLTPRLRCEEWLEDLSLVPGFDSEPLSSTCSSTPCLTVSNCRPAGGTKAEPLRHGKHGVQSVDIKVCKDLDHLPEPTFQLYRCLKVN